MRIAVPDLISNSYFPVIAAVELGFFKSEGLDTKRVELLFPVPKTMEALREGELDLAVGGVSRLEGGQAPRGLGSKDVLVPRLEVRSTG